jgi:hypothetical protein
MRPAADFDVTDFDPQNNDKGVHARFFLKAEPDEKASAEAGRPMFKDTEFVEIMAPGNSTNIVVRPARDTDKTRFRRSYALFKEGLSDILDGTPLTEVPWLSRGQVEELRAMKVRTLEQLADLADSACVAAPGMFSIKAKAKAWLERANEAAPFTKLTAENEELKARLAALEAMVATQKPEPAPAAPAKK